MIYRRPVFFAAAFAGGVGLLPFFSSWPKTDAASVRDCLGVGLVLPARTSDASVEVPEVDCFFATASLLRLKPGSLIRKGPVVEVQAGATSYRLMRSALVFWSVSRNWIASCLSTCRGPIPMARLVAGFQNRGPCPSQMSAPRHARPPLASRT